MKKFSKGILLAAGFAVMAVIGHVSGFNQYVVTKFNDVQVDDLKLNGNDILDSNGVTRVTVGSTNQVVGNVTVSGGTFVILTSTAPRDVSSSIGVTPPAAGALVYNSTDKEICVSTGTTRFTWVEVSTFGVVACRH